MAHSRNKKCPQCSLVKEPSKFGPRRKSPDGLSSICNKCFADNYKQSVRDQEKAIELKRIAREGKARYEKYKLITKDKLLQEEQYLREEQSRLEEQSKQEAQRAAYWAEESFQFTQGLKILDLDSNAISKEENTRLWGLSKDLGITISVIKNAYVSLLDDEIRKCEQFLGKQVYSEEEAHAVVRNCNLKIAGFRASLMSPFTEDAAKVMEMCSKDVLKNRRFRDTAYAKKHNKRRRATDLNFKLKWNLRNRVYSIVKGYAKKGILGKKAGSAVSDLGCSLEHLKLHIESQFSPGMSWDNYGNKDGQWSLDHTYPLSLLDLTDRAQFLKGSHFKNLAPMWHIDNIKKGNKIKA